MLKFTLISTFSLISTLFHICYSQVYSEQIYKFNQVIENINDFYVDSVDESELVEKAIIATLKELDPHSLYFSKEEAEEINRGLTGSYTGIGITYDIIKDTLFVISVLKEGPADIAGLKPGDRIIEINSKNIAGLGITENKLKDLFKGEKGVEIVAGIKRKNVSAIFNIRIKRDEVPVKSISACYPINNDLVYIKLNRFGAKTLEEFKAISDTIIKQDISKIILDLRDNSGGYLYASINLLEHFLEKNTSVLFTKGENSPEKEYKTQISGNFRETRLVVLIDETTASAGEIFSGAIQDWDRGVIVGRRSFGKGLVQKPVYLVDGSMIRLTIARYYTPSGRNIQKPYKSGLEEYEHDLELRLKTGELMHKDSIKLSDSTKFYTLSNHRLIYGGGGIMPDIFIPVDTLSMPYIYSKKVNSGSVNEYVHIYTDNHREEFQIKFKNLNEFKDQFFFPEPDALKLINQVFVNEKNIDEIRTQLLRNKLFYNHIKALIANDLYDDNAFYQIYNNHDNAYLKAIEILDNQKVYHEILTNDIVGEYQQK